MRLTIVDQGVSRTVVVAEWKSLVERKMLSLSGNYYEFILSH